MKKSLFPAFVAIALLGELPIQAHNAGLGDDLCDGKSVDSIGACFFSGD